ncbi:MAG: acyl carrier protein [bacterium]|nr:acyl carrier protein [bacterium]
MQNQAFTLQELIEVVCLQIQKNPTTVSPDTKLVDDLGIDSITIVNIVSELSDRFDVVFEDIDFESAETIAQIHTSLLNSIEE